MLFLESSKEWDHRTHLVVEQFHRLEGGVLEAPPTQCRQEDRSRRLSGQVVPPISTAQWRALAYVSITSVLGQTLVFMNLLVLMQ